MICGVCVGLIGWCCLFVILILVMMRRMVMW